MFKRIFIASAALATMMIGPVKQAVGYQATPVYCTHMYSDATYTDEVGYIWGSCGPQGVQYHLVGTYTYFQVDELVGYCGSGGFGPIE